MSQLITLENLNKVYGDIRDRIDALGDVYSPKGSLEYDKLTEALKTATPGEVYNIINVPEGVVDYTNGSNVVCIEIVEDNKTIKKWSKLGGVYELANNDVAGLVFLGEGTDFDNIKANEAGHAELGLNMGDIESVESEIGIAHKTYVKVPFASKTTYGLVSTEEQVLSGDKTFLNNITINTQLAVGDNTSSIVITPNNITVGSSGGVSTGTLTINGTASASSGSNLGVLTSGVTKVTSLEKSATDLALRVEEEAIASKGSSLGVLEVTAVDGNDGTGKSEVNNLTVVGLLKVSGDAFASNDSSLGKLAIAGSSEVSSLNITNKLIAESLSASTVEVDGVYNTAPSGATSDKYLTAPIINAVAATTTNLITESIDATSVTIDKLVGVTTKDSEENEIPSTLNVQTININKGEGVSLEFHNELKKGASGAPNYGVNIEGQHDGLLCSKNFGVMGHLYAHKVHNAVWNDLADAIEIDCKPEYGYVYCFDGEHYYKSSKYCQKGVIGIHSDTAGMIMGEKGSENELNCAVAGFVLAHVDKAYPSGTPLTTSKDGALTKMKKKDLILHPDRLVANFWKPEVGEKWNGVEVNNRCWVKVK